MQQPNLVINWAAVAVSVVAAFILGGVWYGPLFGKRWGEALGMKMDCKPTKSVMYRAFALQLAGTFLTTYVLLYSNQAWRPSVWGVGADGPGYVYGFFGGFFTWLGFYVPLRLTTIAWENRPWRLFLITAGHDFISLQLISQILANWR